MTVVDYTQCNLCKECVKACPPEAIQASPLENSFIFNEESVGSLPPERIFLEATKILKEKAEDFMTQISSFKEDDAE